MIETSVQTVEKQNNKRVYWLDLARASAIVSITLNHAVNRSFDMNNTMLEASVLPTSLSFFKAFVQIISRIGVPIFLMITGALLLKRDYTQKDVTERFYVHNWLSLLITAEVWYFILFVYKSVMPDSVLRTKGIVSAIVQILMNALFINQDTFTSMWYMPMILCVYLLIPFIAIGVQNIRTRYLLIPLSIAYVSAFFIPNLNRFLQLIFGDVNQRIFFGLSITNLFSKYIIYIVIGKWIADQSLKKIHNSVVVLGPVLLVGLMSIYQFWAFSKPGNHIIEYESTGVLLIAALLFECFRRYEKKFVRWKKTVVLLSDISFGIYFVHVCIMQGLQVLLPHRVEYLMRFTILEVISFLGSVIVIQVLRKEQKLSRILFRI